MKKNLFILIPLVFLLVGYLYLKRDRVYKSIPQSLKKDVIESGINSNDQDISVFTSNLEIPWSMVFLPDGAMLVTERPGRVRFVDADGVAKEEPVAVITRVKHSGEGGLLGIELHPDFSTNGLVYLYYTYSETSGNTLNRVSRFRLDQFKLQDEEIIVDAIPGNLFHNGGRIKFGPDKYLYITTGDAQNPSLAQNRESLAGKILRVDDRGNPAPGNPFNNRIYSFGHRNPQGIAWDNSGSLWETEHGPSGLESGNDEFNKIEIGKNYGWPEIRGKQTGNDMVTPMIESGRNDTWAPAGLTYLNGKFYFTGLRGEALYIVDSGSLNIKETLKGEFGRLRDIVVGPDGFLYLTTSNRDGRGNADSKDDRILRVDPDGL